MEFTYDGYFRLIDLLKDNGYKITNYFDWVNDNSREVILRHDIDFDLGKSLELARREYSKRIKSTYFVLVSSDFYNVLSKNSLSILEEMLNLEHDIGLHFDETKYENRGGNIIEQILEEKEILSRALNYDIKVVSMHRPSEKTLKSDYNIPGMINSYGNKFFKDFKYLSDSRRRWREPVEEIIKSKDYNKIHLLTHAFWYDYTEKNIKDSLVDFINLAAFERKKLVSNNITDINNIGI